MHGDDVGRVARRHLRGELRIAGPGDDVDVDLDVGVFGVEAGDHRGDDPAFAFRLGDVGAAAIIGGALAEEALQIEVGLALLGRAAAERQRREQAGQQPLHRTAVPAIARTICFWKTM